MILHACEKHISINLFFVIDIAINDIYILEHHPVEPGNSLIFTIVAEA